MIKEIENQINTLYQFPRLIKCKTEIHPNFSFLKLIRKYRKMISLSENEIYHLLQNEDLLIYNKNSFDESDKEPIGISEYLGYHNKYHINPNYLDDKTMVKMVIYDNYQSTEITDRPNEIPVLDFEPFIDIDEYKFKFLNHVTYTKFDSSNYQSNLIIPLLKNPFSILSTDIPFHIYKYQPHHPSVYTYDVENHCFKFGNMNESEFDQLFQDIVENGIQEPIFMTFDSGYLLTSDIRSNVILFIAKFLEIPSIPVHVIIGNDINDLSLMKYLLNSEFRSWDKMIIDSLNYVNETFQPNVLIHTNANMKSPYIIIGNQQYNMDLYLRYQYENGISISYRNLDVPEGRIIEQNNEINNLSKRLEDFEKKKLSNDIESLIQTLKSE